MASSHDPLLDTGDDFPTLALDSVAHAAVTLPGHFGDDWGVVLIYRAHW